MLSWKSLLCLLVLVMTEEATCYCINGGLGEDGEMCIRSKDSVIQCCESLEYLFNSLKEKDNVTIYIESSSILSTVLKIVNFNNLTIEGEHSNISCSSDNAGIFISNVTQLNLKSLTVTNCGMRQKSSTFILNQTNFITNNVEVACAIYIISSIGVHIENVDILSNKGTGMILYNVNGVVQIIASNFVNNRISNDSIDAGGGGLVIEFTYCRLDTEGSYCDRRATENSSYTIQDSNFVNNCALHNDAAAPSYIDRNRSNYQGLGRGGGLFVAFRGRTKGNTVSVHNCTFINNNASHWGGGVYVSFRDSATNNKIQVSDSDFQRNYCQLNGGGGLKIVMISYSEAISSAHINIVNCNFISNVAEKQGGGTLVHSSRENSHVKSQSIVNFTNCMWTNNEAILGSAVDISPSAWDVFGNGLLPVPKFTNCIFRENEIKKTITSIHQGISKITEKVGTLLISRFAVELEGEIEFVDNNSNGIFLESGTLTIHPNTRVTFHNNTAKSGGGIALHAFSVLFICSNTEILFERNIAKAKGGAIFVDTNDQHQKISSHSCFIQRSYSEVDFGNATIIFRENTAKSKYGNSIYIPSLQPCVINYCSEEESTDNMPQKLGCIVNVQGLQRDDISTHLDNFEFVETEDANVNEIVPGKAFKLPILSKNELNTTINVVYDATLEKLNSTLFLDEDVPSLSFVSNQKIFLGQKEYDDREENALLLTNNEITLSVSMTAIECPPGHIHDDKSKECVCDASYFSGISKCDRERMIASIANGYWIGLCSGDEQCTGYCPAGFCAATKTELVGRINDIDRLICNNREGMLCGRCTANHSVYYHSSSYICGDESACNYGILLYIISEIFPLTIIFVVIIYFNISFTTGAVNGLILYAQIVNIFVYRTSTVSIVRILTDTSEILYSTTSLNYFSIPQLSFCLWKGAGTLDIIAWKYVTIVYGLVMIVAVYVMTTSKIMFRCKCKRRLSHKDAVIPGLTAFLVMCYSQCTNTTFLLLTIATLKRYDHTTIRTVLFFNGEIQPFSVEHLKYFIPALFFMVAIVIVPPILLLIYPLGLKVLALCNFSEVKIVTRIANIIPVQLFDSLQSCFKDKFRFFSGLYFLYRAIPLLLYAINPNFSNLFILLEIFLILILSVNAIVQPYKEHWHNVIDTLLFANLAIINAISLVNYQLVSVGREDHDKSQLLLTIYTSIQIILIYLPLICFVFIFIWFVIRKKKIKAKILKKFDGQETLLDSVYLPPMRSDHNYDSHEFHKMD